MRNDRAAQYWNEAGLVKLVAGLLLAPLTWFLDLQFSYAMIKWACANDSRWLLRVVSTFSLALVAAACWLSVSAWLELRNGVEDDGGTIEARSYFLAVVGMASSATFALLIMTSLAPRFLLSPCE